MLNILFLVTSTNVALRTISVSYAKMEKLNKSDQPQGDRQHNEKKK